MREFLTPIAALLFEIPFFHAFSFESEYELFLVSKLLTSRYSQQIFWFCTLKWMWMRAKPN